MSWIASLEIRSEDGIWYTESSMWPTRGEAWTWLQSKTIGCRAERLKFRRAKIMKHKHDPDQFTFLQGDACAREWQDSPLVRGDKPT